MKTFISIVTFNLLAPILSDSDDYATYAQSYQPVATTKSFDLTEYASAPNTMYHVKEMDDVETVLGQHGVVCMKDKENFSPYDHIELAKQLGEVEVTKFFKEVPYHPEIALVEKKPTDHAAIGEFLHSDHTYDQTPAALGILVARTVPKKGGDTIFVDMRAAYDQLSPSTKHRIEGMRAYHSSGHVFQEQSWVGRLFVEKASYVNTGKTTTTLHPMVITHPVTGTKSLFVNPAFTIGIEGMGTEESETLLRELYQIAVQQKNLIRFSWKRGDVVIWDNRSVWHLAVNDYEGQHRVMHRVTTKGCTLHDARGRARSEQVEFPTDPLELRRGQTPFELPYVRLLHGTTAACTQNVEGPPIRPWWPEQPSAFGTVLLRAASLMGINVATL